MQYGTQLVEQTRHLYPNSELAENLSAGWLSKLQANSLPDANINGWSQGITELKRLQNRLNQLEFSRENEEYSTKNALSG
ncbi:hypothetical protein XS81_00120 [Salmonella enterica subsp. diarizonae]|nr:hypothetical protein [Salmonella enterica subsp. diarizonae]